MILSNVITPVIGYIIEDEKYAYAPTVVTGKSLDGTLATTLEDFNLLTPAFKEEWFPRASIVEPEVVDGVTYGINQWHTLHPTSGHSTPFIRLYLSQQNLDDDYILYNGTPVADSYMICELYGVFEFAEDTTPSHYAKAVLEHIEDATTVTFNFYDGAGWIKKEVDAVNTTAVRFNANMKNGFADIRFDWKDVFEQGSESSYEAQAFFKTFYVEKVIVTARKKNPMYDTLEDAKSFDLINTSLTTLYGGTRSGIADGTRRFFSGYPEGNLIRWSGLNDITYLPENNFAYVGDDADITALDKQYGALIVFKENSTYNMEYTYTVEDGATTVLFPITPISNEYGCDNPGTLQLVNDRLVWCNTNGRVYILYSQYQYTRKNIADIGGNVYDLLKDNPPTFAAVWDKMYFLFSSVQSGGSYVNRAIIWDFDQSTYYNYYSNEKSQDRLSWFYWDITEITEQLTAAQTFEDVLYLNGANYYALSDTLMDACSIKTKEFDFGAPTQLKNIRRVDIMAEIIEAQTVQVDYFGDNGTILYSDYRDVSEIGNVVIILRPHILRLRTFSVRITGTKLSVQGIIITADTAGRLR
jgi:hydroxymethylpyrimidine pyrophosphatase-like HAD family hydrolase